MDRADRAGLGLSVAGHAALLAALSLGLFAAHNKLPVETQPIDVQFVDEVGLTSATPTPATEAPAPSVAPEVGAPEDAPPPAPQPEPTPAPPEPTPAPPPPVPTPKLVAKPTPPPAPSPKPTPAKPTPPAEAKPSPAKPTPAKPASTKPAPPRERLGADLLKGIKTESPGKAARGARLGDDFLKGIAGSTEGKASSPRAQVSGAAMNGLAAAIKRQVQPCYDLGGLGGTPAMKIVTVLRLRFNRNGTVAGADLVEQSGVDATNRSYARQIAEVGRRAVTRCAPLKLPANLYEGGWEDIEMSFTPGAMQ